MKQCIKYCLIIIFAALLHDSATGAADILCVPATRQAECCTLSQAPTTQQAVQKFYDLFSPNSLCIEHVDHTQVPTNKSVLLRMYIYKMQQHAYAPECDRLLKACKRRRLPLTSPDNKSEVLSSGAMYLLLYI